MPKIMEIIEKETKGKSYNTYKYSYDSIGLPSIDYDDDPNKVMKWKDSGETGSPKKPIDLKPLADQLQSVGEKPLLKYFLDGSRHVFKVDDIAYNKQVFPVVAGQIGIGCCKRENKRMSKERFYRELTTSVARSRILFILRTHAIWSASLSCSVTPSFSASSFTSRRKSCCACSSTSARWEWSLPEVSKL